MVLLSTLLLSPYYPSNKNNMDTDCYKIIM